MIDAPVGITFKPHMIRHSFATYPHQRGAGLWVIQELPGHSLVATVEIFTHVDDSRLRKVHREVSPETMNPAFLPSARCASSLIRPVPPVPMEGPFANGLFHQAVRALRKF